MTVKVTICIPAYNAGLTIAETLDSLLEQSFRDFEIIVSDNYSTDNTCGVVKCYAKHGVQLVSCPFPPVKTGSALDNTHSAIQNWNSLVDLGKGEYVGIFHADDVYDRNIIRKELEFLDSHPECSAVFPTCTSFDNMEGIAVSSGTVGLHRDQSVDIFSQPELVKAMLRKGHFMSSSGPMIRRESWRKAGKIDAEQFEQASDTEFWIRLSGVGPVGIINEPLVMRRIHTGQDSHNGYVLYRYSPLPIMKVLNYEVNLMQVRPFMVDNDFIHLAATSLEEDLRVALNLIGDNRNEEAIKALKRLPKLNIHIVLVYWKEHRKLQLGRLVIGKMLLLACMLGGGKFFAKMIARSRFGFPKWLRE